MSFPSPVQARMDGAGPLLLDLYGRLLRMVCSGTGVHFEGIGSAGRYLFGKEVLEKKYKNKFAQLDDVAAFVRHVSVPMCQKFEHDVDVQLAKLQLPMKEESEKVQLVPVVSSSGFACSRLADTCAAIEEVIQAFKAEDEAVPAALSLDVSTGLFFKKIRGECGRVFPDRMLAQCKSDPSVREKFVQANALHMIELSEKLFCSSDIPQGVDEAVFKNKVKDMAKDEAVKAVSLWCLGLKEEEACASRPKRARLKGVTQR